jgi:hypothetical protein
MYLAQIASTVLVPMSNNASIRALLLESNRPTSTAELQNAVGDKVSSFTLNDIRNCHSGKPMTRKLQEAKDKFFKEDLDSDLLASSKDDRIKVWTDLKLVVESLSQSEYKGTMAGRGRQLAAARYAALTSIPVDADSRGSGLTRICVAALIEEKLIPEYRNNLFNQSLIFRTLRQNLAFILSPHVRISHIQSEFNSSSSKSVSWYIFSDWIDRMEKPTFETLQIDNQEEPKNSTGLISEYELMGRRSLERNLQDFARKICNMSIFRENSKGPLSQSGRLFAEFIIRVSNSSSSFIHLFEHLLTVLNSMQKLWNIANICETILYIKRMKTSRLTLAIPFSFPTNASIKLPRIQMKI